MKLGLLPLTMTPIAELPQNIFDSRDIEGNESSPPSDSDYEGSDMFEETSDHPEYDTGPAPDETDDDEEPDSASAAYVYPKSIRQQQVRRILEQLDEEKLKLVDFLDGLSWGDDACTQDPKIRTERTIFLQSAKLPGILNKWAVPPRKKSSTKRRATGATGQMSEFVWKHISDKMDHELEALGPCLRSPPSVDVEKETLQDTSFQNMLDGIHSKAPTLFAVFESLAYREEQKKRNTHKNAEKVRPLSLFNLSFSRNIYLDCRHHYLYAFILAFAPPLQIPKINGNLSQV